MTNSLVHIYLMTRNRPEYAEEALKSLLNQTYENYAVIVSDNSTDDRCFSRLSKYFDDKKVGYIRRDPPLPVLEHSNTIIHEARADYIMMFHDDDLLEPSGLKELMHLLHEDSSLVAAACNAIIINALGNKVGLFNKWLKKNTLIQGSREMARLYTRAPMKIVPFPGYLYKTSAIKGLQLVYHEGRKHADASFLIKVAKEGPIIWASDVLMKYRIHENNGSAIFDLRAIYSLLCYVQRERLISDIQINAFALRNCISYLLAMTKAESVLTNLFTPVAIAKHSFSYLIKRPFSTIKYLLFG